MVAEIILCFWRTKLFHFIGATTSQETHQIRPKPHATSESGEKNLDHTKYCQRTSFVFSFHNHRLPRVSLLKTTTGPTYYGPSNTKILQTFQSKMFRIISSAPWYVSNQSLHSDFEIQYVTEVGRINANKYKNRSTEHSNQLIRTLLNPSVDRRLKRLWPEAIAHLQWTTDGWCLPHDLFLPQPY